MRLAALFSGGKDSTFAVYCAQKMGHEVVCLLTVIPRSEESALLHHPNIEITKLQAESMQMPHICVSSASDETGDELAVLESAILCAKKEHDIAGVVHGGIRSNFQRGIFGCVCEKAGLVPVEPLWGAGSAQYLRRLVDSGFEFIITAVAAGGLDESWLGRKITHGDIDRLERLSDRHGFNIDFEGGEAETLVTDCPIFGQELLIPRSRTVWDGYRGRFEIQEAVLKDHA